MLSVIRLTAIQTINYGSLFNEAGYIMGTYKDVNYYILPNELHRKYDYMRNRVINLYKTSSDFIHTVCTIKLDDNIEYIFLDLENL